MKDFMYLAPKTIPEAIKLLDEYKDEAVVLNGGTDVIVRLRERLISPNYVIDIKKIKELHEIKFSKEEGLYIGGCVTANELGNSADVKKYYPYLSKAALSIGSKQIRHRATCAGNLVNASPLADTATPLVALDAVLYVEGVKGKRELPIRELFVFVKRTSLAPDEIVTGIRVPYIEEAEGVFTKISRRKEVDLSTVCGSVIKINDEYRLAFGAVAPTPIRLSKTEDFLKDKELTEEVIDGARKIAATEIAPIGDVRASKDYRYEVVSAIITRSLKSFISESPTSISGD